MSLKNNYCIFLIGFFLIASCNRHESKQNEFQIIKVSNNGEELMVPSVVLQKIFKIRSVIDESEGAEFVPISVKFVEKTFGVLKHSRMKFNFEEGGGAVDLDQYVNSINGSFELSFELNHPEPVEDLNVIFINKSRKRRLDGEVWGLPCQSYVDLSDFYKLEMSQKKLLLNTYKLRFLNLILGDYIFSYKKDGKSFISRVSFTTSQNKNLQCENEVL